jgi:hypothetical protein
MVAHRLSLDPYCLTLPTQHLLNRCWLVLVSQRLAAGEGEMAVAAEEEVVVAAAVFLRDQMYRVLTPPVQHFLNRCRLVVAVLLEKQMH